MSSSTSKLDYLSKYYSSGGRNNNDDDDDNDRDDDRSLKRNSKKKKKKDKKEKKTKKSRNAVAVAAYDDDDDVMMGAGNDVDELGEEDEEDRPIVVDSIDNVSSSKTNGRQNARGQWATIDDKGLNVSRSSDSNDVKTNESLPRRRRRYDSEDSDNNSDNDDIDTTNRPTTTEVRRRHDSSSDDDSREASSSSNKDHKKHHSRKRHDSDTDSNDSSHRVDESKSKKRRRYDSDDSSDDDHSRNQKHDPQPRRRHDSDDESKSSNNDNGENHQKRRQRYDSDDSSSSGDDSTGGKERMSSGHKAGLQNYKDFNKSERKIQSRKKDDAQRMVDKYGMGETVYRDQHGRKQESSRDTNDKKAVTLDEDAQRRLNAGAVQQQAQRAAAEEMAILRESSFARYKDDDRLEDMRKNEIRDGDPMAQHASKNQRKKQKQSASGDVVTKPTYKGPPPKPNRYGIRPGYRWDGIDRGNGFEDKLLGQKFSANLKKEEAYRWRSADM